MICKAESLSCLSIGRGKAIVSDVHEGGCLCGSVRYQVTADPEASIVCHCKACQHRTGSAFGVGAYFPKANVKFLSGDLKTFEFRSSTTDRWVKNEFCQECGTTVTWTLEMRPNDRAIAAGTFDKPGWHSIARHIWTESAHPWVVHPSDALVLKKGSPP